MRLDPFMKIYEKSPVCVDVMKGFGGYGVFQAPLSELISFIHFSQGVYLGFEM